MTLDDRMARLEQIVIGHQDLLVSHGDLLERLVAVQEQQFDMLRSLVTLVGSIDDRLGRIEDALRGPSRN